MKSFFRKVVVVLAVASLFGAGAVSCKVEEDEKSSAKSFLLFNFTSAVNGVLSADVAGIVDDSAHTVSVEVPYGTDVTALVATFAVSDGASVKIDGIVQTSGTTPNNFTNPVTYTVTAEDGSKQNYTAAVTVASGTAYTVQHYRQNIIDDGYILYEMENLKGATGANVAYNEKTSYEGFTYDSTLTNINGTVQTSGTIAADGSTLIKLYYFRNIITLTFDLSGGTTTTTLDTAEGYDGNLSGKYGATVSVATPTKTGYGFSSWSPTLPTTFPAEDASYTAAWVKDSTPPADVTSLVATRDNTQIILSWTNPSDTDFNHVSISWTTTVDTAIEVDSYDTTDSTTTTYNATGLTNGISYTFTVKAVDDADNKSAGVTKSATSIKIKKTDLGNFYINDVAVTKTTEKTIIASGSTGTVHMTDDSSWDTYYSGTYAFYKGVFLSGRNVTLSPFVMSQYEVTQELYTFVMENNPSNFTSDAATGETQNLRPVECVSWYDAIVFCNKLSILLGLDPCYTISGSTDPDEWGDIPTTSSSEEILSIWNAVVVDIAKNGYRLPTEAEWEYAARGGNPSAEEWKYAFAGIQATTKTIYGYSTDTNLETVGWYSNNSSNKTHEVGLKKANTLELYDMSGNVEEWCYDWYSNDVTSNDNAYYNNDTDKIVVNPLGASSSSSSSHIARGGGWGHLSTGCTISWHHSESTSRNISYLGFRLCRSAQ